MKISEIRNKMFNLSDLKGLISENINIENLHWDKIFQKYPQFLEPEYDFKTADEMFQNPEILAAMAEDDPVKCSPEIVATFNGKKKGNYFGSSGGGGYKQKRQAYLQSLQKAPEQPTRQPVDMMSALAKNEPVPVGDENEKKSARLGRENTKLLYDFFMNNGGQNLSYSDKMEIDDTLMTRYVDACRNLADLAFTKLVGSNGGPVKNFDHAGLAIGSVRNPFLLFLFIHFVKFGDSRGTRKNQGKAENKKTIIKNYVAMNMEPGTVAEYVKYVVNEIGKTRSGNNYGILNNVFGAILQYNNKLVATRRIYEVISVPEFSGDELAYARSMAYRQEYEKLMSISFTPEEVNSMASVFGYEPGRMFDPLSKITDGQIMAGLQRCCSDGNSDGLNRFLKPSLLSKAGQESPAERIFSTVRSFKNVLSIDFGRVLGASGRNVLGGREVMTPEKMSLLLGPAQIGLEKLEEDAASRGYFGPKIPQAINGLRELYNGEIKKYSSAGPEGQSVETGEQPSGELRLWQLLTKESDTKTQDEIFNFLLSMSDAGTVWNQEYNRFEKQDIEKEEGGLGGKSIDIMGKKQEPGGGERVLCFEYQGEQHYHPVNVRPSDYQYSLFSAMREDILRKCGFSADETGDRKYYYGHESIDELFVKSVIIDTFKEYAKALESALRERGDLGDKVISRKFNLVSEGSSVKSVNVKALSTFTIKEAIDYFSEVASKNPHNDSVFENPPLKGVVPYLCSPCRFFDEVQTALDIERDRVKRAVIKRRTERAGWSMAYVTPKVVDTNSSPFTTDDYEYTLRLAGGTAAVFQWTQDGKVEMTKYLEKMGFRTPELNTEESELQENVSSLFQEIVGEIINENVR